MNKDLYAHLELQITSETDYKIGNSANYKKLANWNNSYKGNVSTIGLNGNASYFGIKDMSGQVYQWTDTNSNEIGKKYIRGGSYIDDHHYEISKYNRSSFDIDKMTNDGQFGFRLASYTHPTNVMPLGSLQGNNFNLISGINNIPDDSACGTLGRVDYTYYIMENLITNTNYCLYLNSIDPQGKNLDSTYDSRMSSSAVGGINFDSCKSSGNKYSIKKDMSNKPVTFITWIMAAKYVNWLSSTGEDIYHGVYDINEPKEIDFLINTSLDQCGSGLKLRSMSCCSGIEAASYHLAECGESTQIKINDFNVPIDSTILVINQLDETLNGLYQLKANNIMYRSNLEPSGSTSYAGSIYHIKYGKYKNFKYKLVNSDGFSSSSSENSLYGSQTATVGISPLSYVKSDGLNRSDNQPNYFLPSENEWYKAAYYDVSKTGYWTYGTKNDSIPNAIIVNATGSAIVAEKQISDTKHIPITIFLNNESVSGIYENLIQYSTYSGEYTKQIPIIQSINCTTSGNIDQYIYSVNSVISGLKYGHQYSYTYDALDGNWPCTIYPATGSFTHSDKKSSAHSISCILKFKAQDVYKIYPYSSSHNLYYHDSSGVLRYDPPTEAYTNLRLSLSSITTSGQPVISHNTIISKNISEIPVITQEDSASIQFQPYTNEVTLDNLVCDEYVPLIIEVQNPTIGKPYIFNLSSDKPDVIFMPSSGLVSFGGSNPFHRITSLVNMAGNTRTIIKVQLSRPNIDYYTIDYMSLKCLGYCDSLENHANYNGTAIWGWCLDNSCSGIAAKQNIYPNVTTVGTNGGPSAYGTYDQDGNILELCSISGSMQDSGYVYRGGSFNSTIVGKAARFVFDTDYEYTSSYSGVADFIGFRIASSESGFIDINNQLQNNKIEFVPIGDIGAIPTGNHADTTGYGFVQRQYIIGKYPVTNNQYTEFLNAIGTGTIPVINSWPNIIYSPSMSGCFGGIDRSGIGDVSDPFTYITQENMESKPVRFISRNMACMFVNWFHNKNAGYDIDHRSALSGVYSFKQMTLGSSNTYALVDGVPSGCPTFYIPSENEWYKAAYYNGPNEPNSSTSAIYWNYATQSNTQPAYVIANVSGVGVI
jgi:formylglycine-generating enzyme required for sulfatase activity